MELTSQSSAIQSCPQSRGPRSASAWAYALLTLVIGVSLADGVEQPAAIEKMTDLPSFLFQPLFAGNEGSVYGVYEARHADLVLVKGGFDSGFQPGMVCQVDNGETEVGEVMLVEVRNQCSAALILELTTGSVIEPGHSVRIKTVKF